MNIRENVYGMHKRALFETATVAAATRGVAQAAGDTVNAAANMGASAFVWLLALSAAGGVGLGYVGAKLGAHGTQDIETAKKQYENERLKADLGYLSSKTRQEYDQFLARKANKPKAARVLG